MKSTDKTANTYSVFIVLRLKKCYTVSIEFLVTENMGEVLYMNGKWIRKVPVLLLVAATAVFLAACGFGKHTEQRENTRRKETGEEVSGVKEIPKGS